ncbi:MAG: VCBS repeat-containing protein [Acidobacteria bacterium]|nr:VCBS repeat-containing protein [Acidobacteriota bacterium]
MTVSGTVLAALLSLGDGTLPAPHAMPVQTKNIDRGLEAFRRQDFAAAENFFRQAAVEDPDSARAFKFLGMSLAAREDYRKALIPFQRACEIDPQEENACYYLGRNYYSLNRFEDAIDTFERVLKHQHPRGRPLLGLALAYEALGMQLEAEQRFKEAIQAGEKRAMIDYGLFLYKNGRGDEGVDMLRKAGAAEDLQKVLRSVAAAASATGVTAKPVSVRFEAAPLQMIVRNGAAGNKHLIETMLAGVAVFDFDNDGWQDIFISNGARSPGLEKSDASFSNRLFRNNGDGTFADVTDKAGLAGEGYCMGVAAGDFNNDAWTDLFVTGVRGNRLYENRGDGTFADITEAAGVAGAGFWAVAAGWLDYDNDGLLDLFVSNYVQWDPATEIYCGVYKPGYRSYCHPKYYKPLPNTLYRNLGNGKFCDVSVESGIAEHKGKGMGMAFGDFDLDGRLDIFVGNDTVANFLFHNQGDGSFREIALEAGVAYNVHGVAISSMGADFRDYDNDSLEDIFVAALTNETFPLFRNVGRSQFVDVAGPARISGSSLPWSGWSNGVYDFNNDGWKDIFTANGHAVDNVDMITSSKSRQPNTVFVNQGRGVFRLETLEGEALHRGCAFGDLDRDGRIDVVVTRLNEPPLVLRNVTQESGNWIRFILRGKRSNRDAIGAWVEIETAEGRQWNRVTTCVGYGGSSEPIVHFGLGRECEAEKVVIRWPSGTVQSLSSLAAGRVHEISEPEARQ